MLKIAEENKEKDRLEKEEKQRILKEQAFCIVCNGEFFDEKCWKKFKNCKTDHRVHVDCQKEVINVELNDKIISHKCMLCP